MDGTHGICKYIVVFGVSGCGKSTVGKLLSDQLNRLVKDFFLPLLYLFHIQVVFQLFTSFSKEVQWKFFDADDFHSEGNKYY